MNKNLSAYVINLDSSESRMRSFTEAFGDKSFASPITRVPGVNGSYLPTTIIQRLANPAIGLTQYAGTLGCAIGHLSALETVVRRRDRLAIIMEDDARPATAFNARLDALEFPNDLDLCFVNNRLADLNLSSNKEVALSPFRNIAALMPQDFNAPGADGYIVSERGANKLVQWFSADGLGHFFDWRLVAYSLTQSDCSNLAVDSTAKALMDPLQRSIPRDERLTTFVACPGLIRHANIDSDILRESSLR